MTELSRLEPGMPIVYSGNKVAHVTEELAESFTPGDRLIVVQDSGDLLHVPRADWDAAVAAVDRAVGAFDQFGLVTDDQITHFYELLADTLEDDEVFASIMSANEADVASAEERGRSTTRLVLSDKMRLSMIEGVRMWASIDGRRNTAESSVHHRGWRLDLVRSGLGVVGFIFEGRPNVLADATGVLRSGNTVVFRIGSDALGTAHELMARALQPALTASGLPDGAVSLVDSPSHAAGWSMFSDPRLALAVARGSGAAVAQLGAVARQTGIPVSLHGTGGSWIVAGSSAEPADFGSAVRRSLDRKVCNTVNTVCIVESRSEELVGVALDALESAADELGTAPKLHVTESAKQHVPADWFVTVGIHRAEGVVEEVKTELIDANSLGHEWEWEQSPEITLTVVENVDEAVALFNEQSPRFGASLISSDETEHEKFFQTIDAPFVGNGFTRWVDGQYALDKPELGLSNWQYGRLFGRGGILSGDSVYTIRGRAIQDDPDIGR